MKYQDFFTMKGRINRAKYWQQTVIMLLIFLVLILLGAGLMSVSEVLGIIFIMVPFLVVVVAGFCIGARRLHDRNKSAWWYVLFIIAPNFMTPIADAMGPHAGFFQLILYTIAIGISIWGFVEMGCLKGTAGDNQYGADPLASLEKPHDHSTITPA